MAAADANRESPAAGFQFRRLIFWDFPRASWPYDLVVALILIFIFATPRDWFRDQPRAASVVLISSNRLESRFFIAGDMLSGVDQAARAGRAEALIHERTGKRMHVTRLEPIVDEQEHETHGFVAYTAP
jgi:hypothetical protein